MLEIKLDCYKNSTTYYFKFLDSYFKFNNINKVDYLKNNFVSPSSFRRYSLKDCENGKIMIKSLFDSLNIGLISPNEISNIEIQLNNIIYDNYYKNDKEYDKNLNYLNNEINKNNLFKPIYLLIKLLLFIGSSNKQLNSLELNKDIVDEVISFKSFYNDDLLDLLRVIEIVYNKTESIKNYNTNPFISFALSSKSYCNKDYIKAVYFGETCQKALLEELNIERLYILNITLMGSYNNLRLYQKCYNLSVRQYYSLKSAKYINDNVLDLTIYNLVVSCIGIHKYEEAYYYADFLDGTFKNLLLYLLCEHLNNIEDNNNYTFENGNDVKIIEDFKNCLKSKDFNKVKEINLQLYELLIYLNED